MKKLNVLLVDDNQHFRQALKYMVEESNKEKINNIYQAGSGSEALNILQMQHIDLVFMDIDMPDMNGIETTRKATELNRFLTIVALSFHQEMQYIMKMLEAGARNYIIKEDICTDSIKKVFDTVAVN
ncbi:MAG TPA: response regulator transcription factor [Bacteroidales bacterium]|nr:response regulator transcription factor [Bacteroidales bacterium]